ncbi:hypothetical protein C0991_003723 [Blastosporella zonata]|nr:hypothetical protein C0991_003723 [Blastosporella zonata]
MATGQVALMRHRTPGTAQRPSRQAVPAFLQKLHEMVNDPNNAELIRWSDAGDSFFVLDHERFAREVLGRWFKHQNFASFVRQLNMYGFHKIPHLQQGVLKSDTDTEHWNFAHANFRRGQPDLLCLIQRKKQPTQPGDDAVMDLREPIAAVPVAPLQNSSQVVDVNSILNGISAIKRHQATISSELNDLKQSNQMLWQDAMDARQKHQKQQDTINRIVKFLAGVFGNRASPHKDDVVGSNSSRAVVPRRQPRFLIEDGIGKVTTESERAASETSFDRLEDLSGQGYPIIETPGSIPSPSTTDSDAVRGSYYHPLPQTQHQPTEPSSSTAQPQNPNSTPHTDVADRSVTPSRSSGGLDMDRFLNQLTPSQIQQLLSTIPNIDLMASNDQSDHSTLSQITQYTPTSDLFHQFISPTSAPQSTSNGTAPAPAPADGLLSFDSHELGLPNDTLGHVAKQWTATEDIEREVNSVDTDLETFIRGLGIDPDNIDTGSAGSSPSTSSLHLEADDTHRDPHKHPPSMNSDDTQLPAPPTSGTDSLFDFDSFMNSQHFMNTFGAHAESGDGSFSADDTFKDLQQGSVSPEIYTRPPPPHYQQGAPIPGIRITAAASKRKSDASELHIPISTDSSTDGVTNQSVPASTPSKPTKRRRNK